tara:strand:- start:26 stop:160 length:135 start_codon:yes stop_codon:yes gene_type:complete
MEKLTLSSQLVNAILQYLGQRPYVEVLGLIKAMEKELQVAEPKE